MMNGEDFFDLFEQLALSDSRQSVVVDNLRRSFSNPLSDSRIERPDNDIIEGEDDSSSDESCDSDVRVCDTTSSAMRYRYQNMVFYLFFSSHYTDIVGSDG